MGETDEVRADSSELEGQDGRMKPSRGDSNKSLIGLVGWNFSFNPQFLGV